jgi:L-ascorbate metabolism protein UlaG (beta-lactamase superfamily)
MDTAESSTSFTAGQRYTPRMSKVAITWLGHATCLFRSPGGARLLIDPWLKTNPACPPAWHSPSPLTAVLITHGHSDHTEDAAAVARATGATVVANFEICNWLARKGVRATRPMNKGGTVQVDDVQITMVDARHSSSYDDNGVTQYLGEASGFVLRADGAPTVYCAGDTSIFGDMRLIADLYAPEIACLPIGDVFTMGPAQAAAACELLRVKQVVPVHHGTFPLLTGTPAALRALVEPRGVQVLELQPGETAE